MTLEKAIEILTLHLNLDCLGFHQNTRHAVKLGVEALERLQKARSEWQFDRLGLLQGETK